MLLSIGLVNLSTLLKFKVPLVVKVTEDGSDLEDALGTIIRIDTIDPSRVMIGTDTVEGVFYMMRDSGYDTIRSV